MSDWQVGDLALCVNDSRGASSGVKGLIAGRVYVVAGVEVARQSGPWGSPVALTLSGTPNYAAMGWSEERFRKIHPDAEPCEEEFTVLIKRMKPAKVKS